MDEENKAVEQPVELDDQGRRKFDENGEPIHWASKRDRVVALVLALIVIAITIAMAYSLSTGEFVRQ